MTAVTARTSILTASVAAALLLLNAPASAQLRAGGNDLRAGSAPIVTAGVRPVLVRPGDPFVVTVRVVASRLPDLVELLLAPGVAVRDIQDATSVAPGGRAADRVVFQRVFHLDAGAEAAGRASLTALAVFGGDTVRSDVPDVTVAAPGLRWSTPGTPSRRGVTAEPLRAEGTPPDPGGRSWEARGYGPWVGEYGWGPSVTYPPPYGGYGPYPTPYGAYPAPHGGYAAPYGGHPQPYGGYPAPYGGYAPPFGPYAPSGGYAPYARPGGYGRPYGPYPPGAAYPDPDGVSTPKGPGARRPEPGAPTPGGPSRPWFGPTLPPGEGWAASADEDPWWPELVPELLRYDASVDHPGGLVRLEAGITPAPVYVGQQATLVVSASFAPEARYRMGGDPEFFPPGAGDAWVVDVPYAPPAPAARRGRVDESHTFMRAYFPHRSGTLRVDAPLLLWGSGAGSGRRLPPTDTLATPPLSVQVLPIPEASAPDGWDGAVGRYAVRSWTEPVALAWNESALLTLEVRGAGHIPSLPRPRPPVVWGGGARPLGERAWVEVRDGVVGGVKIFTWLLTPVEAGTMSVDPMLYAFFDPWVGGFGVVATEEIRLEVTDVGADPRRSGALPGPQGGEPATSVPPSGPRGREAATSESARPEETAYGAPAASGALEVAPASGAGSVSHAATLELGEAVAQRRVEGPDVWLELGARMAATRPGTGWSAWAWRSGLAEWPRDAGLRTAAWNHSGWEGGAGLPRLPLNGSETGVLLLLLGGSGLAAAVWTARGTGERRQWVALTLLLFLGTAGLAADRAATASSRSAVMVGGDVHLRESPTMTAAPGPRILQGTPVRLEARWGAWFRVRAPAGEGWVEGSTVAVLGVPPLS